MNIGAEGLQLLAAIVLILHLAWIFWVIFGALWTRNRPALTAFHIGSLIWGIVVEVTLLPCPLTDAEQLADQAQLIGNKAREQETFLHALPPFAAENLGLLRMAQEPQGAFGALLDRIDEKTADTVLQLQRNAPRASGDDSP